MNKTSGHILFCCYQLNFLNCYILKAVLMLDNVRYSASMIVNFLKLSYTVYILLFCGTTS